MIPYLTLPGMKMVFFWIRRNIQKMFPWIYKGFNFWSWVVWGRAKSSFSGIQRWNYCISLFRHFLAPKYLFCYAVSSFLYYILSVFLLATCMHAKVWHFFLNEWHWIKRGSAEDLHPSVCHFTQINCVNLVSGVLS